MTNETTNVTDNIREWDALAREETQRLENTGRLDAGFTETYYPLTTDDHRELRRLTTALLLADSATTYVALTKGEAVPKHRLRPDYLAVLERWPT